MVVRRSVIVAVEPLPERGTCLVMRIDATLDRDLRVSARRERELEVFTTRAGAAALLDSSWDVMPCDGRGTYLRLEDDDAQSALMDSYERLVDEITDADPAPFDDSAQRVVWALCWPREPAADRDLLEAHWACLERASCLCDLENPVLLALDASALAPGAAAGPRVAQAAEAALSWDRGERRSEELRHRLAPDARPRGRRGLWDYGLLGVAADGAIARAWGETVSWALAQWEDAVMDELQVRATGLASPYRAANDLRILRPSDSGRVARDQAASAWREGAGGVFGSEALVLMAGLVQERTGLSVSSADLAELDGADGAWSRSVLELAEKIGPRFESAHFYAAGSLPWPAAAAGEGATLDDPSEERPWQERLWDEGMEETVFACQTCVSTVFAGYGSRLTESMGPLLASLAWRLLDERAMASADEVGLLARVGRHGLWAVAR